MKKKIIFLTVLILVIVFSGVYILINVLHTTPTSVSKIEENTPGEISLSCKYYYWIKITGVELAQGDDGWYQKKEDYFIFDNSDKYSVYHRNKYMYSEKYEIKDGVLTLNFPDRTTKIYRISKDGKVLTLDSIHKYVRD